MDSLGRAVLRSVLRSARVLDEHPALKCLLDYEETSSKGYKDLLLRYFKDKRYYVPTAGEETATEHVRRAYRNPLSHSHSKRSEDSLSAMRSMSKAVIHQDVFNRGTGAGPGMSGSASSLQMDASTRSGLPKRAKGSSSFWAQQAKGHVRVGTIPEPGDLLLAHPLQESWFRRAVVLVVSHSLHGGTFGVVINRVDQDLSPVLNCKVTAHERTLQSEKEQSHRSPPRRGGSKVPLGLTGMASLPPLLPTCSQAEEEWFSDAMHAMQNCGTDEDLEEHLLPLEHYIREHGKIMEESGTDEDPSDTVLPTAGQQADAFFDRDKHMEENGKEVWVGVVMSVPQDTSDDLMDSIAAGGPLGTNGWHERRVTDPERDHRCYFLGGPVANEYNTLQNGPDQGGELTLPDVPLYLGGFEADQRGSLFDAENNSMLLTGECLWQPMQLEDELAQGNWLHFKVSGKHLIQKPKRRSLKWWYNGLPDYESVLLAAGPPFSDLALVTEAMESAKANVEAEKLSAESE